MFGSLQLLRKMGRAAVFLLRTAMSDGRVPVEGIVERLNKELCVIGKEEGGRRTLEYVDGFLDDVFRCVVYDATIPGTDVDRSREFLKYILMKMSSDEVRVATRTKYVPHLRAMAKPGRPY